MESGVVVGAYRIVSKIGEGGMGTVWLAQHALLGRRAAIKVLHPKFSIQPEIVQRFFNEARAATAISDPGIVQIFDFGYHVDGSAFIAMEMLEGEPLDKRLSRLGRLSIGDALRIVRQAAGSLGVAHAHGIVHRDLKPENIFLAKDPEMPGGERPKLLDFGIAKLTGHSSLKTDTSAVMGTPSFMSPEQCRGAGHVDQRADIYSLGCVLFTLITGRLPFEAEGAGELISMHLREMPRPPSVVAPGIPPEVDALVLRCLAKDPAQRFASGTELAAELCRLVAGQPVLVGDIASNRAEPRTFAAASLRPMHVDTTLLTRRAPVSTVVPHTTSRRWLWIALVVMLFAASGFSVRYAGGRGEATGDLDEISAASRPHEEKPLHAPATGEGPRRAAIADRMKRVLFQFEVWSRGRPGAPCPGIDALDSTPLDPWGRAFWLTCSDQPADQIVGVVSAGPDGSLGTLDDVASWHLDRDVTERVRGARWGTVSHSEDATGPAPKLDGTASASSPGAASRSSTTSRPAKAKSVLRSSERKNESGSPTAPSHLKVKSKLEFDEFGLPKKR